MFRYLCSSISHSRRSLLSSSKSTLPSHVQGYVRGFSSANWSLNGRNQSANVNANASGRPNFLEEIGGKSRQMDFVRGARDEDEKSIMGGYINNQYHYQHDADFVHIKMLRNNTFVTVTDSKGNVKLSGSAGSLKDLKSGQKLSKFAAEATAEMVGRRARGLGLKSVVMKVNGFTHFRRKRNAILSWREGFMDSKGDRNPIVYVEDTTRRAHNGCRLPKSRRI
ncbi:probable ribosomal protein S11, mitochondrial [Trifolium pratense]|uniref:probable ribosomal protein S11, mitochondrial n=1 Tax=Trifolium pratense TaxID=57577 RepID=UPI001E69345D|nr:probable ribosomal protein S11, mitochondrial [Trifolium pratense]